MANYFRAPGGGSAFQSKEERKEARNNFNSSSGYYGVPLDHECPIIVCDCFAFLRNRGFYEVGVFRVPGNQDMVNDLKAEYNEHFSSKEKKMNNTHSILNTFKPMPSVNDVASLLKLFFTELPEPLMQKEVTDALIEVSQKNYPEDKETAYFSKIIGRMKSPNRECLGFLISFLRELCAFRRFNQMSANNLATCFVLSVMGKADAARQMMLVTKGSVILRKLIDQEVKIMMPSLRSVGTNTRYIDDTQIINGKKVAITPAVIPKEPPTKEEDEMKPEEAITLHNESVKFKELPPLPPLPEKPRKADPFPEMFIDANSENARPNPQPRSNRAPPKPPSMPPPHRYANMGEINIIRSQTGSSPNEPESPNFGYNADAMYGGMSPNQNGAHARMKKKRVRQHHDV